MPLLIGNRKDKVKISRIKSEEVLHSTKDIFGRQIYLMKIESLPYKYNYSEPSDIMRISNERQHYSLFRVRARTHHTLRERLMGR